MSTLKTLRYSREKRLSDVFGKFTTTLAVETAPRHDVFAALVAIVVASASPAAADASSAMTEKVEVMTSVERFGTANPVRK